MYDCPAVLNARLVALDWTKSMQMKQKQHVTASER